MPKAKQIFSCEEFTKPSSAHYFRHYKAQEKICDVARQENSAYEWLKDHPNKTLEDWRNRTNFSRDAEAAHFEYYYLITITSEKGTYYGFTLTTPKKYIKGLFGYRPDLNGIPYEVDVDFAPNATEARRWLKTSIREHTGSKVLNERRVPTDCSEFEGPNKQHYYSHYFRDETPCYDSKKQLAMLSRMKTHGTLEGWTYRPQHTIESILEYCESDEFNANGRHYQAHYAHKVPFCMKARKEESARSYLRYHGTLEGWEYRGRRGQKAKPDVSMKLGTTKSLSNGFL